MRRTDPVLLQNYERLLKENRKAGRTDLYDNIRALNRAKALSEVTKKEPKD